MADIDMEHVRKLVLIDEVLNRGLRNWHMRARVYPGCNPGFPGCNPGFDDWLDGLLDKSAASAGESATDEMVYEVVRLNTLGDVFAVKAQKMAELHGLQSDICCYVEDNQVSSSVYVSGKWLSAHKAMGDAIANMLKELGYETYVMPDDVDENNVVVSATIDFPKYLALKEKMIKNLFTVNGQNGKIEEKNDDKEGN